MDAQGLCTRKIWQAQGTRDRGFVRRQRKPTTAPRECICAALCRFRRATKERGAEQSSHGLQPVKGTPAG